MRGALVTGCSRGIGRAVAEMLLNEGYAVTGSSRTDPHLTHRAFRWVQADVSLPHQVERLAHVSLIPFDAVIHCAGIRGPHGPLSENDPVDWLSTIRTNLLGAYHVTRLTLPCLLTSDDGRILLFSGGGAFNASPEYSAYAVAKAGVVSLMETLAEELRGTTVTVNCVAPGPIPTAMTVGEVPDDGGFAMSRAVACVRHLLAPAARGLTGKTISAVHDDWHNVQPWTVTGLNASDQGTRTRHPIAMLAARAARAS